MTRGPNLQRRGGRWYVRIRVPRDLRPRLGCLELKRALSLSHDHGSARRVAIAATSRAHDLFWEIRRVHAPTQDDIAVMKQVFFDRLKEADLEQLRRSETDYWVRFEHARTVRWRRRELHEQAAMERRGDYVVVLAEVLDILRTNYPEVAGPGRRAVIDAVAAALMEARTEFLRQACEGDRRRAELAGLQDMLEDDDDDLRWLAEAAADAAAAAAEGPAGRADGGPTPEEVHDAFRAMAAAMNAKADDLGLEPVSGLEVDDDPGDPEHGIMLPKWIPGLGEAVREALKRRTQTAQRNGGPRYAPAQAYSPAGPSPWGDGQEAGPAAPSRPAADLPPRQPPHVADGPVETVDAPAPRPLDAQAATPRLGEGGPPPVHRAPEEEMHEDALKTPSGMLDEFLRQRRIKGKTRGDYAVTVTMFEEIMGRRPIISYTRKDLVTFIETLSKLPIKYKERFGSGTTAPEAIKQNAEKEQPYPTLSRTTIKDKRLANIRTLFLWFSDTERIPNRIATNLDKALPAAACQKGIVKKRDPFTPDQLQLIFDNPLFHRARSVNRCWLPGNVKVRNHKFWMPLILLFTGARPSEVGPLTVNNVEPLYGHPCFRITTVADPNDPDAPRSVKNPHSERRVPVHPQLIEIGFLDYVEDCKRRGQLRLFPELKGTKDGHYSNGIGRFFNKTFLPKLGLKTKRTCLYSLRHTMSEAGDAAGFTDHMQFLFFGWSNNKASSRYKSRVPKRSEIEAFLNLRIDGLDLSRVRWR